MGYLLSLINAWAMPEVICNGENGYLIGPNNREDLVACMKRLVNGRSLLKHTRQRCLQVFTERFSVHVHNHKLRSIYDEALTSGTIGYE